MFFFFFSEKSITEDYSSIWEIPLRNLPVFIKGGDASSEKKKHAGVAGVKREDKPADRWGDTLGCIMTVNFIG